MGLVDGGASILKVNQRNDRGAIMTVIGNPVDRSASYFSTSVKGTGTLAFCAGQRLAESVVSPAMKASKTNGFTLTELFVAIVLVGMFAAFIFSRGSLTFIQVKGRQTAALSNVKGILLACKIYAADHDGEFPTYALDPKTLKPSAAAGRRPGGAGFEWRFRAALS